ncbi:glycosyltransferase family 92 protein [Shimia ponticola]|uniref:glycosyltransferase family 92 protein n=1 Tax=Shimia ponticola TaxID=2582893 RepID=UPI0011BD75DB|nr:glycosyltransferase family 92 protein [Shimia ponticola]
MWWFKPRAVSKIRFEPPKPQARRAGLAIAFTTQNEARHIAEWARFHRLVGVEHFVVYDNGSTDGTVDVLREAVGTERVTFMPWHQKFFDARRDAEFHNQVLCFAHAVRNFGGAFRWMAFTDVDEFLVPKQGKTVPEVLEPLGDFGCLSVPWAMFGRGGQMQPPEDGVLPNYLMRNRDPLATPRALRFKCIIDACQVTAVQVHEFEVNGKSEGINEDGLLAKHSDRASAEFLRTDKLQLNHYYTRSDAELRAKIARGSNKIVDPEKHAARVWRSVNLIEQDVVEDRCALDLLARHGVDHL